MFKKYLTAIPQKIGDKLWERRRRTLSQDENMLPVLIEVFAAFCKLDGKLVEAEIDSSLSFLRYDYPDVVYSEMRLLFTHALEQEQRLDHIAQQLSRQLPVEEKILLGFQLYVLISKSGIDERHMTAFYQFMAQLGVTQQAVELVYQLDALNADTLLEAREGDEPLEVVTVGHPSKAEVGFRTAGEDIVLAAYRFRHLLLVKNIGRSPFMARGQKIAPDQFCRIYEGQHVQLSGIVISDGDLHHYLNIKKKVASTKLYLTIEGENYTATSTSSKSSSLEIDFGLQVTIRVLREVDAVLSGERLIKGTTVRTTIDSEIVFAQQRVVSLEELSRQARTLGARFDLPPTKRAFLVSNNPHRLSDDDILLSQETPGEIFLRITCHHELKTGEVEILRSDHPIYLGKNTIRHHAELADGDILTLRRGHYLRCNFSDGLIEEERNILTHLEIDDLTHHYVPGQSALEGVNLSAQRGEMICIMGPSGCGKSTLLRILAGHLQPERGDIYYNGLSLYRHLEGMVPYLAYIPHEDAYDPLLTVEENMASAAIIRSPHLPARQRFYRVQAKLTELGLIALRHRLASSPTRKTLSGGERKRLNVGLDTISPCDIFLVDEPTTGLSSKDSEHVLEILRGLSRGRITLVSIHQPSAKLFHLFDKALLLDKGGKMAFYGTPTELIEYFQRAAEEENVREINLEGMGNEPPFHLPPPDFIFDVLETPLRDLKGDIIYREDRQGHLAATRRFPPEYWRDRYQTKNLLAQVKQKTAPAKPYPERATPPQKPDRTLRMELRQLQTQLARAFLSKFRNRRNLLTTLVEAPLLALLVAGALRFSENGDYNFATAFHVPTYIFLSLVVGMFLGLTNSADEILKDRIRLEREKNFSPRVSAYVTSKLISLATFALIQSVLYLLVGNLILSIRGMFWIYLGWMFLTTLTGVALGLLISTFFSDGKAALNVVPLVLVPQIILGGALIKYEEMNRNLDFIYSLKRWWTSREEVVEPQHELSVPLICEAMPLRWAYEGLILAQANHNPVTQRRQKLRQKIQALTEIEELSPAEENQLQDTKEALAYLSGLEAPNARTLDRKIRALDRQLRQNRFDREALEAIAPVDRRRRSVSAEEIYLNQKITDLVDKAEMERLDYRDIEAPNVFLGKNKRYLGHRVDTRSANSLVLIFFIGGFLIIVYLGLKQQLRRV